MKALLALALTALALSAGAYSVTPLTPEGSPSKGLSCTADGSYFGGCVWVDPAQTWVASWWTGGQTVVGPHGETVGFTSDYAVVRDASSATGIPLSGGPDAPMVSGEGLRVGTDGLSVAFVRTDSGVWTWSQATPGSLIPVTEIQPWDIGPDGTLYGSVNGIPAEKKGSTVFFHLLYGRYGRVKAHAGSHFAVDIDQGQVWEYTYSSGYVRVPWGGFSPAQPLMTVNDVDSGGWMVGDAQGQAWVRAPDSAAVPLDGLVPQGWHVVSASSLTEDGRIAATATYQNGCLRAVVLGP